MFWKPIAECNGWDGQLQQKLPRAHIGTCDLTSRQLPGILGTTQGQRDRPAPKLWGSEIGEGGLSQRQICRKAAGERAHASA